MSKSRPLDTGTASTQATASKPTGVTGKSTLASDEEGIEVDEEEEMMRLLGFGNFDSTKGKPVEDNFDTAAIGAVKKNKKRVYRSGLFESFLNKMTRFPRQYMNRRGGFNKPLAKID